MQPGEGLVTDMRAVRKDYFLEHDHSASVDQWDWELAITEKESNLTYLTGVIQKLWKVLKGAEQFVQSEFPVLKAGRYPDLPEELTFIHAEELLERYPDLPRKARETKILQEYPAVFIYGIGWTLKDGYPHEMRAPDYDDWVTETVTGSGPRRHGLTGASGLVQRVQMRLRRFCVLGDLAPVQVVRYQFPLTPFHGGRQLWRAGQLTGLPLQKQRLASQEHLENPLPRLLPISDGQGHFT